MLSKSQINLYQQCPRKYRYRYIDKVPQPTPDDNHPLTIGIELHSIFEETLILLMKKEIGNNYNDLIYAMATHKDFRNEYQIHIENFADFILTQLDNGYSIYGIETFVEHELFNLLGYLDLILEKDGKLTVIDFKTGKTRGIKEYELELVYYGFLANYLSNKSIDKVGIFFSKTNVSRIAKFNEIPDKGAYITQQDIDYAFKYLFQVRELISNGIFNYKKGWNCKWCEYEQICINEGYNE